jgi:hypothetical protein
LRLRRGRWRGTAHVVGAGRAVHRDDDVDRCAARLRSGPAWAPRQPTDHRVRPRGERHAVRAVGTDPCGVAMSLSVLIVGREVQPAALEIGRRPSRKTELSVNHAVRRVATSRAKHHSDQTQQDSSSHTSRLLGGARQRKHGLLVGGLMRSSFADRCVRER